MGFWLITTPTTLPVLLSSVLGKSSPPVLDHPLFPVCVALGPGHLDPGFLDQGRCRQTREPDGATASQPRESGYQVAARDRCTDPPFRHFSTSPVSRPTRPHLHQPLTPATPPSARRPWSRSLDPAHPRQPSARHLSGLPQSRPSSATAPPTSDGTSLTREMSRVRHRATRPVRGKWPVPPAHTPCLVPYSQLLAGDRSCMAPYQGRETRFKVQVAGQPNPDTLPC